SRQRRFVYRVARLCRDYVMFDFPQCCGAPPTPSAALSSVATQCIPAARSVFRRLQLGSSLGDYATLWLVEDLAHGCQQLSASFKLFGLSSTIRISSFAMAHRNRERKRRAHPFLAFDPDPPPVQFHKLPAQGEP